MEKSKGDGYGHKEGRYIRHAVKKVEMQWVNGNGRQTPRHNKTSSGEGTMWSLISDKKITKQSNRSLLLPACTQ